MCHTFVSLCKTIGYIVVACFTFISRPFRRRSLPDFKADIALVTGAAQGLGREIAFKLAECGATLVLWDINEEKVRSVCDELKVLGGQAFAYGVDCSKREEIYATADRVREEVGNVSILVNNAAVVGAKTVLELEDDKIELTMRVNTMAHFWVSSNPTPSMSNVPHYAHFNEYIYTQIVGFV